MRNRATFRPERELFKRQRLTISRDSGIQARLLIRGGVLNRSDFKASGGVACPFRFNSPHKIISAIGAPSRPHQAIEVPSFAVLAGHQSIANILLSHPAVNLIYQFPCPFDGRWPVSKRPSVIEVPSVQSGQFRQSESEGTETKCMFLAPHSSMLGSRDHL